MSTFEFDPNHRASPEYPDAPGTGQELYEQGYTQCSNRYRLLKEPVPKGLAIGQLASLIDQNLPLNYNLRFREMVEGYYTDYIAKTVSATDGQFLEFKKAQKEGGDKEWLRRLAKVKKQNEERALKRAEQEAGSLTLEQAVAACKNIGYDLTCGACAALFLTGVVLPTDSHDFGCFTAPHLR